MSSSNYVINLNYLNELAKGDTLFIKEMIGIFLNENPEEIKQLETFINTKNYEKIQSISHHMKSTIPFVGLDLLIGDKLNTIENLAIKQGNIEEIKKNFYDVKIVCNKGVIELETQQNQKYL